MLRGLIPTTTDRVPAHTADAINQRIRQQTAANLVYYAQHPDEIEERLKQLDAEWDVERVLEANASLLAFAGTALGATIDRRWLTLPAVVTAFLFQHAVQGWCPPLPLIRRLGVRTAAEIDHERYALKMLRGDFNTASRELDNGIGGSVVDRMQRLLAAVRA